MQIHISNKNGITLGDLRNLVQETEQLSENTIILVPEDYFSPDVADTKVTEVIADEESISFYY